jgi:hypothetical protein
VREADFGVGAQGGDRLERQVARNGLGGLVGRLESFDCSTPFSAKARIWSVALEASKLGNSTFSMISADLVLDIFHPFVGGGFGRSRLVDRWHLHRSISCALQYFCCIAAGKFA